MWALSEDIKTPTIWIIIYRDFFSAYAECMTHMNIKGQNRDLYVCKVPQHVKVWKVVLLLSVQALRRAHNKKQFLKYANQRSCFVNQISTGLGADAHHLQKKRPLRIR